MLESLSSVLDGLTENAIILMQILLLFMVLYYAGLAVFGLFRRREPSYEQPEKRFAIVVAAHNEEKVLGPLLENLKDLDYPPSLYDIFVIADNCTDSTAKIARENGVYILERFDEMRGKGYALEWGFNQLFAQQQPQGSDKRQAYPNDYDAVVVFDADNLVKRDFLLVMNAKMQGGARIIQGYLDAKNPYDTWVTNAFAISFWMINRMLQLARSNLGLSNILAGTGMCIETGLLRDMGWGAHSLSEDLEFTARALLRGVKTSWAHDAVVFDEKPLGFWQSCRQRKRWAQGHVDVSRKYLWPLLQKGVQERKWTYIDIAIHLFQPYMVLIGALLMLIPFTQILGGNWGKTAFSDILPPFFWQVLFVVTGVLTLLSFILDRIPLRAYGGFLLYPVFMYTWIPILIAGFVHHNRRDWCHTEHSRSLHYRDLREVASGRKEKV